jgi:soluble lytic murein transglycosylase
MLPRLLGILLLMLLGAATVNATTVGTMLQRKIFIKTEAAINKGKLQLARQLKSTIKSYPLYPYLEYELLKKRLASQSNQAVQNFLDDYADTPLVEYLRLRWLDQLAKKKRWQDYVDFYQPQKSIDRQCHYLNALIHTGEKSEAFKQVEPLWLYGKSRPKACDPVFAAWKKSADFHTELVWQRIELAIDKGQLKLVRYLGKQLPASDKPWLDRWIKAHKKPYSVLQDSNFKRSHKYKNKILAHAVKREIRHSVFDALDLWRQIQKRHQFHELETHLMNRKLAFWLIREEDSSAYDFVANVEPCSHDSKLQEARLRAGLLRRDWPNVLSWLSRLPADEQATERWQYWQARALQQQGDQTAANKIFEQLAESRSYYGFSAADQVKQPYHFAPVKTPVDQDINNRIKQSPTVSRIEEFMALDRMASARREWYMFTRDMNEDELMAAAMLAKTWGWHDQAIFTLARSEYWDDHQSIGLINYMISKET